MTTVALVSLRTAVRCCHCCYCPCHTAHECSAAGLRAQRDIVRRGWMLQVRCVIWTPSNNLAGYVFYSVEFFNSGKVNSPVGELFCTLLPTVWPSIYPLSLSASISAAAVRLLLEASSHLAPACSASSELSVPLAPLQQHQPHCVATHTGKFHSLRNPPNVVLLVIPIGRADGTCGIRSIQCHPK